MKIRMFSWILGLILPVMAMTGVKAQDRDRDHDELRALFKTMTQAMNARDFKAMAPLLHDKFSITTVDQRVFTNLPDFEAYFNGLVTGDRALLKSITFNPTADVLTEFVGDDIGFNRGTSTDTYVFADGETRVMTSRWTATVCKDNGRWKILNVHIGVNLLDNPVIAALKSKLYQIGIGAGLAGLVVGLVLMRLIRRKPA